MAQAWDMEWVEWAVVWVAGKKSAKVDVAG
jgi:hypothetical protein